MGKSGISGSGSGRSEFKSWTGSRTGSYLGSRTPSAMGGTMNWSPVSQSQSLRPEEVVICVQPGSPVAKQSGCKTCFWVSIAVGFVALLFLVFLFSGSKKNTGGGYVHVSQDSSSSEQAGHHTPVVVPTKPHHLKTELTKLLGDAKVAVKVRAAKAY